VSIAERLAAAAAGAGQVAVDELGTATEMLAEAAALAAGPQAPYLASAFCKQLRSGRWTADDLEALLGFVAGLGRQQSYLALREAADVLLGDPGALGLAALALHDALLPGPEIIAASPLLAGLRLDIALEVAARTSVPPYRVLDLLTRPVDGYPEDFDDPLARALGVAADVWTEPAERRRFAAALSTLAARGSADAAHENAVALLRDALVAESGESLAAGVRAAQRALEDVSRRVEGRDDAAAYAQTCAALIAFERADKTALEKSAREARAIAGRRALLTRGMHSRRQATARHSAALAWTSLAWRLETAAAELAEDAFLDTWGAVEAVIDVYQADRQLAHLGTVSSLIRPRIVNVIAQREAMTRQLERAVAIDRQRSESVLPQGVYELLDLVHRVRSAGRESADDAEESSPDDAYLRALLGPDAGVLADLPAAKRASLEEAARQSFMGTFAGDRPANDTIDQLTARLIGELGENEAFAGQVKANFSLLVLYTVRFLVYVGDTRQAYTKPVAPGAGAPLERELQKHFHQYLSATDLAGRVGMEHSNIAGGRADVITTFDGAQRYATEVKREQSDASRGKLEAAYLAQALEYQSTSEPLGQLLVLDLTDHSAGTPHISHSVWVTHRRDAGGAITSSAVVAVVRGNRPAPSAMASSDRPRGRGEPAAAVRP